MVRETAKQVHERRCRRWCSKILCKWSACAEDLLIRRKGNSRKGRNLQRQASCSAIPRHTSNAVLSGNTFPRQSNKGMRRSQSCGALSRQGNQIFLNNSSINTSSCEFSDSLRGTAAQVCAIQRRLSSVFDTIGSRTTLTQSQHPAHANALTLNISQNWGKPEVEMRWLRWTIALWLGTVAALPWLQWAFSLWRGALLRAEFSRLRWFLLADGATNQAMHSVSNQVRGCTNSNKKHLSKKEKRQLWFNGRVSRIAWSNRVQSLAVFIEWAGAARRSGRFSVSSFRLVLCAFSAWVCATRPPKRGNCIDMNEVCF